MAKQPAAGGKPSMTPFRLALFGKESVLDVLKYLVEIQGRQRGFRTRLAEVAGCQPSYVSQVLAGTSSFSHEQLFGIATLLELDDIEWEFLRELAMLDRAGTEALRADCRRRLTKIKDSALGQTQKADREAAPGLLNADTVLWYVGTWQTSAVLAAIVSPRFQTVPALAKCLGVPQERMTELVRNLVDRGLLKRSNKGHYSSNLPTTVYLGTEAAGQIFRSNWLQHGLSRAQNGYRGGYQKGGVFRCSRQEFQAIRAEVEKVHRSFFADSRDPNDAEVIGYFGIELFEAQ